MAGLDPSISRHFTPVRVASKVQRLSETKQKLLQSFVSHNHVIFAPLAFDSELICSDANSKYPLTSGLFLANPVPAEYSMSKESIDSIIDEAVRLADVEGFHGSDNTPFILDKIKKLSNGKSIIANKALIEGNVARGTKVAVELAKLELADKPILDR